MSPASGAMIWISWEDHRRTTSIARRLGIPLHTLVSRRHRLLKHPLFVLRTLGILLRERPRVLIIQSPSIFLNLLAVLVKPLFGFRLVVDAHNGGVYSCEPLTDNVKGLYPFLQKHAEITIVTNETLADLVRANGGRPRVLVDPLPPLEAPETTRRPREFTFICTYAADEPYLEVIEAAGRLPHDVIIHVTGNVEAHRHKLPDAVPPNLRFTGFLPEEEFVALLASVEAVIDLTTWSDCLVCGGYESLALGTPLILSDSPVNRETFVGGVLYCDNTAEGIAAAVREVLDRGEAMRAEARQGRRRLEDLFTAQLALIDWEG